MQPVRAVLFLRTRTVVFAPHGTRAATAPGPRTAAAGRYAYSAVTAPASHQIFHPSADICTS